MNENVIWCNASLPCVPELSPAKFIGCVAHVACWVHNGGALATQLQNAWCQVLGSDARHNFTNHCASSETNQVKGLLVQLDCHINTALNTSDVIKIRVFLNELIDHRTRISRNF